MQSHWRAEKHRLGWAIVCDAPLGITVEFGHPDLGEPMGDWIFNIRADAEVTATMLNEMEAEARRP